MYLEREGRQGWWASRATPDHPISQGRPVRAVPVAAGVRVQRQAGARTPLEARPRRTGAWTPGKRITWDEAMDHHRRARAPRTSRTGATEAVAAFQGHGPRRHALQAPATGLCCARHAERRLPRLSGDSVLRPALRRWPNFILGAGYPRLDYAAFFPDRFDDPRYVVPEVHRAVGQGPAVLQPRRLLRPRAHRPHEARLQVHRRSIPRRHLDRPPRAAYHLQLRPGTDAALGLGHDRTSSSRRTCTTTTSWKSGASASTIWPPAPPSIRLNASRRSPGCHAEAIAGRRARGRQPAKPVVVHVGPRHRRLRERRAGRALRARPWPPFTGDLDVPGGVTPAAHRQRSWASGATTARQQVPPGMLEQADHQPRRTRASAHAHRIAHPDEHAGRAWRRASPIGCKMAWFIRHQRASPNTASAQRRALVQGRVARSWNSTWCQDVVHDADGHGPAATCSCRCRRSPNTNGMVLPHFGRNTRMVMGAMNKTRGRWATASPTWKSP